MFRILLGLFVVIVIFIGGIVSGGILQDQLDKRFSLAWRINYKIEGYYNSVFRTGEAETEIVRTNKFRLEKATVYMPLETAEYAGGIDATEDGDVLLLDRVGAMFLVNLDGQRRLDVVPPENGIDALEAQVEEGRFGAARVDLKWHRYNDVLIARDGVRTSLVVSYTEWHPERFCFTSTLATYTLPEDTSLEDVSIARDDWTVLMRTEPCMEPFETGSAIYGLEAGGRLAQKAGDVSHVIWTVGQYERGDFFEGLDFTQALGLRDGSEYGRVLEVALADGSRREIARGLRNPQGLAIDGRNRIWVTDHGAAGGDELNLAIDGRNFGFPAVSYGRRYDGTAFGNRGVHGNHEGYDEPTWAFVPSVAPSAAVAVENFHPDWDGDVIVGTFKDRIYRMRIVGDRAAFAEPIPTGVRTRDLTMTADNRIAIWTDDRRMIFFTPTSKPSQIDIIKDRLVSSVAAPETQAMLDGELSLCVQCHSFEDDAHGAGPSLLGVCGRRAGGTGFAQYSTAMLGAGHDWSADTIAAYLTDPNAFVAGTTMGYAGLSPENALHLAEAICPG